MQPNKILVVAAHPDDEIMGCGATIAKYAARGAEIRSLILGEGVTSRKGLSAARMKVELKSLRDCARKANAALGVARLTLKDFPDNRFDSVPRLKIIHAIEAAIGEFHPDLVFTHSSCDLNVDHQIASEAVRTACRPLPGGSVREILAFETPSATEWRFDAGHAFQPNVFVDVSTCLDKKIQALSAYTGELRSFPHPRSEEYIRSLARVRGSQSGLVAAEAFSLVRRID